MQVLKLWVAIEIFACILGLASAFASQDDEGFIESLRTNQESIFIAPYLNGFIPGISQIWYGKYTLGLTYLGGSFAVVQGAIHYRQQAGITYRDYRKRRDEDVKNYHENNFYATRDKDLRVMDVFNRSHGLIVGLSRYDSFREAVDNRRAAGEFSFLGERESALDLVKSPFDFRYITRPTSYGYLLLTGGLVVMEYRKIKASEKYENSRPNGFLLTTSAASTVGTVIGEETTFRGWIYPLSQHLVGNAWVANGMQSIVFALMHRDSIMTDHAIFGFYSGYVTSRNNGQLGESIFIHYWGNMIGQTAAYYIGRKKGETNNFIMLPQFEMIF